MRPLVVERLPEYTEVVGKRSVLPVANGGRLAG
jgi:hypothetical protein